MLLPIPMPNPSARKQLFSWIQNTDEWGETPHTHWHSRALTKQNKLQLEGLGHILEVEEGLWEKGRDSIWGRLRTVTKQPG